ncbi:MAG: cell division protein FtsB [Succinivibrio sp.]|jgi:cell division protein FtsB|nr:cell division protein FtsB [Succinivibrio sp.]
MQGRMKLLGLVLVLAIGFLAYDMWYGRNGFLQYESVAAQVTEAKQKSEKLTLRNQALEDEITDLQQGNLTLEELARDELGMIRQGEVFYRVIDGSHPQDLKRERR